MSGGVADVTGPSVSQLLFLLWCCSEFIYKSLAVSVPPHRQYSLRCRLQIFLQRQRGKHLSKHPTTLTHTAIIRSYSDGGSERAASRCNRPLEAILQVLSLVSWLIMFGHFNRYAAGDIMMLLYPQFIWHLLITLFSVLLAVFKKMWVTDVVSTRQSTL